MKNLYNPQKSNLHYNIYYVYQQIGVFLLFLHLWIYDAFLILRNLKSDKSKYNLSYSSIVFNALFKYPLLGFRPSSYFIYRLYKNSYKDYENFLGGISRILRVNKYKPDLLDDKLQFKLYIEGKIQSPSLIAYFDSAKKKIFHIRKPKSEKIVIKPLKGLRGEGINIITSDKLEESLMDCPTNYIAEEYINQHSFLDQIFKESVNTLRILTIRKNEGFDVIHCILKIGRKNTNQRDNISQGGISINISSETGQLGNGYTLYEYGHEQLQSHPDSNYIFHGKNVPYLAESKKIAIQLHELFPMFWLIGWDISIIENGPVVVEGNRIPDLSLHQIHQPIKKQLDNH